VQGLPGKVQPFNGCCKRSTAAVTAQQWVGSLLHTWRDCDLNGEGANTEARCQQAAG
jgi:hypothetical protein